MYGPFWLATTLIVQSLFTSFFNNRGHYQLSHISSLILFVTFYFNFAPTVLYVLGRTQQQSARFTEDLCLFGYSYCVYVPLILITLAGNTSVPMLIATSIQLFNLHK